MTLRTRLMLLVPLLILSLCTALLVQPLSVSAATHPHHKASASVTLHPRQTGKPSFAWQKGYHPGKNGHQRNDGATNSNLIYHGGTVMVGTTQVYEIFWEPTGSTVDPSYHELLKRYFTDVGTSTLYQNNTQYTDKTGNAPKNAQLAGTWVDTTTAYPANPMLDSDIQNEVQHAVTANGWGVGTTNIFFVFLASKEVLCADSTHTLCSGPNGQFCAYHLYFTLPGVNNPFIYAAMPYDGDVLSGCYGLSSSPNNDPAADAEISTASHEQMEAVTDPLENGWYGVNGLQDEIGDKCAYQYLKTNPDGSNVKWNGNPYIVQSEWDNSLNGGKGGCSLGSQIAEYPTPTSNSGVVGITAGPDGNLWFTESTVSQIGRITPSGAITEYPIPAGGSYPYDITAGPDGNLWFADYRNNAIGKITPDSVITEYPISSGSRSIGITAGPDGNLWFTEPDGNAIGKITPNGVITEYPIPTSNSNPGGITAGPDGNLWFTEPYGNNIGKITPGGAITEYPVPNSGGITAGPDGNLWFTEFDKIGRITPSGAITEYPIPTSNSNTDGITAGPDGNLWFTESTVGQIGRITPGGAITEYSIPTAGSYPLGITEGPDGSLWFTEDGADQIGRITTGGSLARFYGIHPTLHKPHR